MRNVQHLYDHLNISQAFFNCSDIWKIIYCSSQLSSFRQFSNKLINKSSFGHKFCPKIHISIPQLAGNMSGEDVKTVLSALQPPNQPHPTSKDCWHVHSESWMRLRLLSGEKPQSCSTDSAPLFLFYQWKLHNLPCRQNAASNECFTESAPLRKREEKKTFLKTTILWNW